MLSIQKIMAENKPGLFRVSLPSGAAAFFLAALAAGCEFDNEISSPDKSDLSLAPAQVFLEAGKTNLVEFTASGGTSNYAWSMNNGNLGTLLVPATNSAKAVYQNTTNTGNNLLTVRDADNNSANARITQR